MPTVKFNAAWIKFVTTTTTQVDYFDKSLTGFFLRVSPQGRKSFGIMYRHAGRLRRMTFGTYPPMTLKDARKEANQKLRQAANGEDPATEKAQQRKADTFQEMALQYVELHAKPHKKSWPEDERRINKHLIPIFGNWKAKEITRRDIRPVLEELALKTPIEANRVRSLLRKIYNWAILNEIVDANPVTLIPAPGEEKCRQRVLTEDEIIGLWKVLDGEANGMKAQRKIRMLAAGSLKLRLLTAQRGGEVMGMRWDEVDSDWWTIPPERSKNGLAHRVPLTPLAIRLLDEMKKLCETKPTDFVFPGPRGGHIENVQKTIQRVRRGAGFHFVGHDLRRTAASLMTGMGIPRLTVKKILNHVEKEVTAVYDRHSYDAEKREALENWAQRLMKIVSEVPAGKKVGSPSA